MKNNFLSFVLFAIIISVLFSGCATTKEVTTERILPSNRLVKKLEGNRRMIKTFHGTGVLSVDSPDFSANATFEISMKKPDSIKVSVYGPFGIDLAHVLVTKYHFAFYDVMRNNYYTGEKSKELLKRLFKVDLSFDDLMDAFAGSINLTDKLRKEPDDYSQKEDSYYLTYNDTLSGKNSYYKVEVESLAITNYKIEDSKKKVLFSGEYTDFRNFENVPIPYITTIENKAKEEKINIEYRKIKVNEKLSALKLDVPNDVKKIEW